MSEVRGDKAAGGIPEELVDRFFDRELDEGSREKFFGMLRGDLGRCAEVAKTQTDKGKQLQAIAARYRAQVTKLGPTQGDMTPCQPAA